MKKLILLTICHFIFFSAKTQLVNTGFEQQTALNRPSSWKPYAFLVMPLDTTCVWLGLDSMGFTTTNAHTGNYAYEMRVATYCTTGNGGNIQSSKYDIDTFADHRLSFTERPMAFTFYYQFSSVQDDQAMAEVVLEKDFGSVGSGIIMIQQPSAGWNMATIPIMYDNADTPAYITMRFRLYSDSVLHYGSRFTIDDVNYYGTTGVGTLNSGDEHALSIYPVPADRQIFITVPRAVNTATGSITIIDAIGSVAWKQAVIIKGQDKLGLPTADLAPGIYHLMLNAGDKTYTGRFIK